MSSKILAEIVFVGSGDGSSVKRGHGKVVSIATLIMVSAPLGLVAALLITYRCLVSSWRCWTGLATFQTPVLVSSHKGLQRFGLSFRVMVTMSSRFALSKF